VEPIKLTDLTTGMPITDWLVLGPFVIETSGHFEREYMYERERVLDVDYLKGDGGEANVVPEPGKSHANIGLGEKYLKWQYYSAKYLDGMRIAGKMLYATVQRNCVIYAAKDIESDRDCTALVQASHSGMKVWMNGNLVCNQPYGRTKGARVRQPAFAVRVKKGLNLLLIKFRPGYICDGIDFRVQEFTISPLVSGRNFPIALGALKPLPLFKGTPTEPRQIIEAALLNTGGVTVNVRASLTSKAAGSRDFADVACPPEKVTPLRLTVATPPKMAGRSIKARLSVKLDGETIAATVEYKAATPPKYEGTNYVLASFHFDTTYHEEQRV